MNGQRELILYATPTGTLAAACDRYFDRVAATPTAAQTYPPHCTLTGFFHRRGVRADRIIEATNRTLEMAGPVPDNEVEVVGLVTADEWVGLEIRSPWLQALAASVAAADDPDGDEDPLRLKDWLHLSLAYGVSDLDLHRRLARTMIDPQAQVGWEVALWERRVDDPDRGRAGITWTRR